MLKPKAGKKIVLREEGDEAFLFNPDNGDIKTLNETGILVWKLCNGKNSKDDIVSGVVKDYDVDKKTAEKDVEELLQELKKGSLISCE
jgi:hypothetical protein